MYRLTDYPWRVFLLCFVVLWLCALLGARLRRSQVQHGAQEPESFTIVLTAALTLLGLIIGFTFSMALNRYDQRKAYEAEEANAIGTEYVRAGLLPASYAATTRMLLKSYVDQRVLYFTTDDTVRLKQIDERTSQLQGQLWSVVQKAALEQPNVLTSLAAAGMNDVLNSQGYTQAAWWNRIPPAAWILLLLIAMLCNLMVGFASKGATARSLLLVILPLLVAIALLLIADIDSPRGGEVRVGARNLQSLSAELH